MTSKEELRSIASEIQLFNNIEQKETFLFVIVALFSRVISLKKAAELMEIELDVFIELLDLMGLEFSYLTEEDIAIEKDWSGV
ncbi:MULTISPECIES: hypothetical protein [unclassified Nostoc]|uniref:hypothetical protein n=1 Tax=unclassified Nostoc TaxID=2593658 RepID=UPI002AD32AB4|nr:hypothetical protein [Nostoc sp. DedQUE03]MDZ7971611.1 hypothetical protein [Nostoc sp. DedQUE03]MDZ8046194.1 hypothetical protein [Nostoc sp. DedQUE02]